MGTTYMYASTISLTNSSVMNIVGISYSEDVGKKITEDIMTTYRKGDIDNFISVLKKYGVNVYLDEVPYRMYNINETREGIFKKELDTFLNKKGGKFNIGSNSILPIEISRGF